MAVRKFIDLEEAAKMLGVSPETVTEMRDRGKLHGYRDGGSWKFKPEEIERAIADRESAEEEGEYAEVDEDPDSILLSEVELGQSDDSTSSTIIGGRSDRNSADSDIQLAALSDIKLAPESDIQLSVPKSDSSLDLDSALTLDTTTGSDVLGGSNAGSGIKPGSGVSPMFDELDTLDLDLPTAADSGISSKIYTDIVADAGSSKTVMGTNIPTPEGSGLIGMASEDELALGEAAADDDLLLSADSGGSAIDLADDVDDDLVLGGSSHGDLSRTGDSGISLLNPADSGLSLESPQLELGGSAVESLDLGDDDMILTEDEADAAAVGGAAGISGLGDLGGEAAADEQSDDDFLLTPLEEGAAEESDSGSQVIALDDDVEFEEAGAGALEAGGGGLLEDDLGEGLGGGGLSSAALAPAPMSGLSAAAAAGPAMAPGAAAPEAPFSGWNVVSLALCASLLLFCGMFMFDLLRNMWSWNEAYSVNSSMMDMVLSWFEG
jgi:excisionase family DNA binding protein